MLRGRYDNANQVTEEEEAGVAADQRHPNITISFMKVRINSLLPPTAAFFFHAHVVGAARGRDIFTLHTYEPMGRGQNAHIHNRAWAFRRPADYAEAWQDPGVFLQLVPSDEENEELIPVPACDVQYRRTTDGNFVTEGMNEACRVPVPGDSGMYRRVGVATLTENSYSFVNVIHLADGTVARRLNFHLDKVSPIAGQPIRDFDGIKDALVGGASGNYRIDLRRCATDEEEFGPHVIGGPIEEYQYVPAGAFGPIGYLRTVAHSLTITQEYRRLRLITLHIYETRDVQFFLDEKALGDRTPRSPKVFNCTLNSGPQGNSILMLRRPRHFRQLYDVTSVGVALMSGQKVRMTVDLSLCERHDNGTDIITQGGTMIKDHDMLITEDQGRVLGFNTAAVSASLPHCTPGNMLSGASATLREKDNNVTLHQWGITFSDFQTCFQTAYDCEISSPGNAEGTTFFVV